MNNETLARMANTFVRLMKNRSNITNPMNAKTVSTVTRTLVVLTVELSDMDLQEKKMCDISMLIFNSEWL